MATEQTVTLENNSELHLIVAREIHHLECSCDEIDEKDSDAATFALRAIDKYQREHSHP
jgi:hypothetical protein